MLLRRESFLNVKLQGKQNLLDRIGHHIYNVFNFLLAESQTNLFEYLYIEGIPIINLLADRVRGAVVV